MAGKSSIVIQFMIFLQYSYFYNLAISAHINLHLSLQFNPNTAKQLSYMPSLQSVVGSSPTQGSSIFLRKNGLS